ncbi:MAG: DUF4279 domain-containing protein, partial [Prosthecobacter sp.]|nr:DUF4279 domain-containing protein [Prosthecobacter sp.]
CVETYATLRFYHKTESPEKVTALLKVEPTKTQVAGSFPNPSAKSRRSSGWFLRSAGYVESRDVRRHVDWILDQVEHAESQIEVLCHQGWRVGVVCYWLSIGQGGPMLDPAQMIRLVRLNLSCGFDVYYHKGE